MKKKVPFKRKKKKGSASLPKKLTENILPQPSVIPPENVPLPDAQQKPPETSSTPPTPPPHRRQHQRRTVNIGGLMWTPHQAHILQMSSRSESRKRIAPALGITKNTLNTEMDGIYHDLGIHSKEEFIGWCILSGVRDMILPPDE